MNRHHNTSATDRRIPEHVAIIMDGNGRWATERGMDRSAGHVEGVNTVRKITEAASEAGVGYLTLYAFSTENWQRPQAEVDALMHLIVMAIERETPDLIKNNVRLTMIGDFERMPAEAMARLQQCMADTAHCTGLTLCLALSYSSRWEITEACRRMAAAAAAGTLTPEEIFLLWQIAYSEIYITPTYWPDFSKADFERALDDFAGRERRFGLTSDQVKQP